MGQLVFVCEFLRVSVSRAVLVGQAHGAVHRAIPNVFLEDNCSCLLNLFLYPILI